MTNKYELTRSKSKRISRKIRYRLIRDYLSFITIRNTSNIIKSTPTIVERVITIIEITRKKI